MCNDCGKYDGWFHQDRDIQEELDSEWESTLSFEGIGDILRKYITRIKCMDCPKTFKKGDKVVVEAVSEYIEGHNPSLVFLICPECKKIERMYQTPESDCDEYKYACTQEDDCTCRECTRRKTIREGTI